MALKLIWNNIIDEPTDVIVTPASRKPRIGTGLDGAIHKAAGHGLEEARKKLGTIEPGVVKDTPSFGLRKAKCHANRVIHALGPWCKRGELDGSERPLLFGCYLQILCTAVALKAKTVSIPVMSSGKFGMPMPLAVDTAVEAIRLFLSAVPKLMVKLVGIDRDFYEYASNKYPGLIESRFDAKAEAAYRNAHQRFRGETDTTREDGFAEKEDSRYFRTLRFRRDTVGKSFDKILRNLWQHARKRAKAEWDKFPRRERPAKVDGAYLLRYRDLEARSGISVKRIKRYFATTGSAVPTRDVLISLLQAMGAPYQYVKACLLKCKYSVERAELNRRDWLILEMCEQGKNLAAIDIELRRQGLSPLKRSVAPRK